MQLTLKQARRVEREIGADLDIRLTGSGRSRSTVSVYEDLRSKVESAQQEVLNELHTVKELVRIRFVIRKAIETANEASGLNVLMNREAELKTVSKILTSLMTVELTDEELEIAVQRHAAAKLAVEKGTAVQSRYGEATDELTLGTMLRTKTLDELRVTAATIQRELLSVVDKQAALNVGRTVTVSDEDAAVLEANGFVL